jgi:hypothetical protein
MGMSQLAGLLRGNSHNGKSHPLSERDAYEQIYGERRFGHHAAPVDLATPNGRERPRDARGRFVPRSATGRAGS